jgi:hypothetical protein
MGFGTPTTFRGGAETTAFTWLGFSVYHGLGTMEFTVQQEESRQLVAWFVFIDIPSLWSTLGKFVGAAKGLALAFCFEFWVLESALSLYPSGLERAGHD